MSSKGLPRTFLVFVIVAVLVVGSIETVSITGFPTIPFLEPSPPPRIGIIDINFFSLLSTIERENIVQMVQFAIKNESIKAVVLKIDSPGGFVDVTQEVYNSVRKLSEQKPVVTSIVGIGASGAYYVALAGDPIFAQDSSVVGSVGVLAFKPERIGPFEQLLETGPNKLTGSSEIEFSFKIQAILDSFVEAVELGRGDRLKIDRTELTAGSIYPGSVAKEKGLIDEIGSSLDAIDRAAEMANLTDYEVVNIRDLLISERSFIPLLLLEANQTEPGTKTLGLQELRLLTEGTSALYVYLTSQRPLAQLEFKPAQGVLTDVSAGNTTKGNVLIDAAHKNAFNPDELNYLIAQIVVRDFTISFLDEQDALKDQLTNSSSFIVISPTEAFSREDIDLIRNFTQNGGRLLVISDPTRGPTAPINLLASEFGVAFSRGFLWNIEENYGNYRDIILDNFTTNSITEGVKRIVLFTAGHIFSMDGAIAFTSSTTSSTEAVGTRSFTPMVLTADSTVLAIADRSFLTGPFSEVEDNEILIGNIAEFLTTEVRKDIGG